jgi:hypothetical protein
MKILPLFIFFSTSLNALSISYNFDGFEFYENETLIDSSNPKWDGEGSINWSGTFELSSSSGNFSHSLTNFSLSIVLNGEEVISDSTLINDIEGTGIYGYGTYFEPTDWTFSFLDNGNMEVILPIFPTFETTFEYFELWDDTSNALVGIDFMNNHGSDHRRGITFWGSPGPASVAWADDSVSDENGTDNSDNFETPFRLVFIAVPEPSTYALIFGAVALGFAISKRKLDT